MAPEPVSQVPLMNTGTVMSGSWLFRVIVDEG